MNKNIFVYEQIYGNNEWGSCNIQRIEELENDFKYLNIGDAVVYRNFFYQVMDRCVSPSEEWIYENIILSDDLIDKENINGQYYLVVKNGIIN